MAVNSYLTSQITDLGLDKSLFPDRWAKVKSIFFFRSFFFFKKKLLEENKGKEEEGIFAMKVDTYRTHFLL